MIGRNVLDILKSLYGEYGVPHPIASYFFVVLFGALIFAGAWWVIGIVYINDPSRQRSERPESQAASADIGNSSPSSAQTIGDKNIPSKNAAKIEQRNSPLRDEIKLSDVPSEPSDLRNLKEFPKDTRTTEELFRDIGSNKYGLFGSELLISTTDRIYVIPFNVQMDSEANSKFVSFLVEDNSPQFPEPGKQTFEICLKLAQGFSDFKKQFVNNAMAATSLRGEVPSEKAKRMKFSGQVYLYSNVLMTPRQMLEIETAFRNAGAHVTFRDFQYLYENAPAKSEPIWKWP